MNSNSGQAAQVPQILPANMSVLEKQVPDCTREGQTDVTTVIGSGIFSKSNSDWDTSSSDKGSLTGRVMKGGETKVIQNQFK